MLSLKQQNWHKFEKQLRRKKIPFLFIADKAQAAVLKRKWLQHFAGGTDTRGIYIEDFMWHIFSYERVPCKKEDAATRQFLAQDKYICFVLNQHHDSAYLLSGAQALAPDDLYIDSYVIDVQFQWTYVVTHESECGPYFASCV